MDNSWSFCLGFIIALISLFVDICFECLWYPTSTTWPFWINQEYIEFHSALWTDWGCNWRVCPCTNILPYPKENCRFRYMYVSYWEKYISNPIRSFMEVLLWLQNLHIKPSAIFDNMVYAEMRRRPPLIKQYMYLDYVPYYQGYEYIIKRNHNEITLIRYKRTPDSTPYEGLFVMGLTFMVVMCFFSENNGNN